MQTDWWNTPRGRLKRWLRDVAETVVVVIQVILVIALVVSIFVGLGVGLANALGPSSCNNATDQIGHPHQWTFWGGCKIEVEDGQWVPLENYEYVDGVTQ